jgi:hypothetical protein
MSKETQERAIIDRRTEIEAEIARLKEEAAELDIALRVLRRFGGVTLDDIGQPTKLGPPRPEGAPSLFEMTDTVIRDAIKAGKPGLRNREIVAEIGKKYWPGVQPQQVLPAIYGFVKKGRINKGENGVFRPVD